MGAPEATAGAVAVAQPVLRIVSTALIAGPTRLGLGALGLVGALAVGAPADSAAATFGVGAVGMAAVVLSDPRRRLGRRRQTQPVPASAVVLTRLEAVARAMYPSTAGLVVLVGVSIALDRGALAAILSGFLAGLGIASVVSGIDFLLRERRSGLEYYAAHRGQVLTRDRALPSASR